MLVILLPGGRMTSPSSEDHRRKAHARGPVPVAIVTVSDSRTPESDENGAYLRREVEAAGHLVAGYRLIRDEPAEVAEALDALVTSARIILFNGGTGISSRDSTYDAIAGKLEKVLPGFGEIFRMLSYEQVGAAAMLSRATAGTHRGAVVISTPGSPAAVRLAWEKLIAPEIEHLAWEVGR
jgi:molybdopterin adenylyltransferase